MALGSRCAAIGAAAIVLSGCSDGMLGGIQIPSFLDADDAPESILLYSGAVVAEGPNGYCVSRSESRAAEGFALMLPCAVLEGEGRLPNLNGFVTVQVGAPQTASVEGSEEELRGLLREDQGLALLSASQNAETVSLLETDADAGVVSVYFEDRTEPARSGTQLREWRVFSDLNDRLVTVSVRGLSAAPLGQEEGRALLFSVLQTLKAVNG